MHQLIKIQKAFSIKANLQAVSYIYLKTNNIADIKSQLQGHKEQAPKFLSGAIVILDFSLYAEKLTVSDIVKIINLLKSYSINPVGFRNANNDQVQIIQQHTNLLLLTQNKSTIKTEPSENKNITKTFQGPVRSGQEIQNLNGDLVIIGSINPGAKVIASGNIHVYGKVFGKIMAGAYGDKNAKIYLLENQAELISIAGIYQNGDKVIKSKKCGMITLKNNSTLEFIDL